MYLYENWSEMLFLSNQKYKFCLYEYSFKSVSLEVGSVYKNILSYPLFLFHFDYAICLCETGGRDSPSCLVQNSSDATGDQC